MTWSPSTCDLCRKSVEPHELEAEVRYYCRDCAAAHDLDVPLCKAATESILAELATRDPFQVACARAAMEEQALRDAIRVSLHYLTDREDVESTPLHAIGHAVEALKPFGPEGAATKESHKDIAAPEGAPNSGPGGEQFARPAVSPNHPGAPGPRAAFADEYHERVLAVIGELINLDPQPDSPEGKLLSVLASAAESFEREQYPIDPPEPTP